ncbi:hypothetical protein PTKIN_Ptkin16aG0501500 [Pterospermum kingtungense]
MVLLNNKKLSEDQSFKERTEQGVLESSKAGISYWYTEDDIQYYFEGCGTIIDVDCVKFSDTGKFRGIAIITFKIVLYHRYALAWTRKQEFRGYAHEVLSDSVSVVMALKLDQEIVCSIPAKISCAVPKNGVTTQSRYHPKSNEAPPSKEEPSSIEALPSKEVLMLILINPDSQRFISLF